MKKVLFLIFGSVLCTHFSIAQVVNIPDQNFKNALLFDSSINTNGDNEIQVSEAINYKGYISLINSNISNLTGIEAFINIIGLGCRSNKLFTLDLSKNINLIYLFCDDNELINLDLSKNINLIEIDCSRNKIITLDLTKNKNLTKITCSDNHINSLIRA